MAEINNSSSQQKHQRTACNKKSTKVDLAPMVDLGFILITFFVFTAALSQPVAMNMVVPNDNNITIRDELCETCVLTVLLGKNNRIWYYGGKEENAVYASTNYSANGIRKLIQEKKKSVFQKKGSDEFVLIIKPTALSSFKNLVDMVDECSINIVKRYYIDEPTVRDINKAAEIRQ